MFTTLLLVIMPSSDDINEGSNDHTRYLGETSAPEHLLLKERCLHSMHCTCHAKLDAIRRPCDVKAPSSC